MARLISFSLLLATTLALAVAFLGEPLLGDDLTYWSTAGFLHAEGLAGWNSQSFYDLRWPVWGMCWLLQAVGLAGLGSFWGVPIIYLMAGAALTFVLARCLTSSPLFAFSAGLAFFFHPFLDPVASAPMPDLSEAIWGAAAILSWWKMLQAPGPRRAWLWAGATGLCIFVLEANRVTGLFLVPVLVVCTTLFFRARFRWLIAAGLLALLFYAAECFFYHRLFGDWLHDLTVNALNRGAKGTELTNPWLLPFRFLDSFWREPLMRCYSLGTLAGLWFAWRRGGIFRRVLVVWCGLLLLEFSCTPQSLRPLRPLLRDAPRFLASMAIPMSLLAVFALHELLLMLKAWRFSARFCTWRFAPVSIGASALLFLIATTRREFFNRGFVPEVRRYLASVPDGATVFTHYSMREMARLVSPRDAARVQWLAHPEILEADPALEAEAESADEFWYSRNLSWLRTSQRLNRQPDGAPPQLASYFAEPEKSWRLMDAIVQANAREIVFYRRRTSGEAPRFLDQSAAEWRHLLPALPAIWERAPGPPRLKALWQIPPELRGRLVRLQIEAAADDVDAVAVRLRFFPQTSAQKPLQLRPLLTRAGGPVFFALAIPRESTACEVQVRFSEKAQRVALTRFHAWLEAPSAP